MTNEWTAAQQWEKSWWLSARDQHPTEIVKNSYVARLLFIDQGLPTKSVIDIGCGPLSLLLRVPVREGTALDPNYYDDLEEAYEAKGIRRLVKRGEDLTADDGHFDEAWIYNCLQHVQDPTAILQNAMKVADAVRIFEWTHIPPYQGHLHELTPSLLEMPFMRANWRLETVATGQFNGMDEMHGNYFAGIYCRP